VENKPCPYQIYFPNELSIFPKVNFHSVVFFPSLCIIFFSPTSTPSLALFFFQLQARKTLSGWSAESGRDGNNDNRANSAQVMMILPTRAEIGNIEKFSQWWKKNRSLLHYH
jgi:hypothetical protein